MYDVTDIKAILDLHSQKSFKINRVRLLVLVRETFYLKIVSFRFVF